MSELLNAVVAASTAVVQPLAERYAAGNRPWRVRVERPAVKSSFDRATLTAANPTDQVVYTGAARIALAAGGSTLDVGDERTVTSTIQVSIDSTGQPPRVDDIVIVLDEGRGLAAADGLLGRTFTVLDVEVGGHYDVGYRMTAQGTSPSRRA